MKQFAMASSREKDIFCLLANLPIEEQHASAGEPEAQSNGIGTNGKRRAFALNCQTRGERITGKE